ncbi:hypothetical protein KI387_003617, partial [Taxus chinensis]
LLLIVHQETFFYKRKIIAATSHKEAIARETTEFDDEDQTHSGCGDQNVTIVSPSMQGNMASGHVSLARRPPIPPTRQVQTQRRTSGKNIRIPAESAGT